MMMVALVVVAAPFISSTWQLLVVLTLVVSGATGAASLNLTLTTGSHCLPPAWRHTYPPAWPKRTPTPSSAASRRRSALCQCSFRGSVAPLTQSLWTP